MLERGGKGFQTLVGGEKKKTGKSGHNILNQIDVGVKG